ncbi:MAG: CrcB family protein [Acidimicrobiia bacterium]|jgi:CrcB protein|nr:MAG: CrcB family protein [Acidimicrobiia bacterium]
MVTAAAVALGGALGASLRYGASRLVLSVGGEGWVATALVNVVGAGALGFLAGWWASHEGLDNPMRIGLTTGLLGGFTTFSTWVVESAGLWDEGRTMLAALNLVAPVLLGIIAVAAGLALGRAAR